MAHRPASYHPETAASSQQCSRNVLQAMSCKPLLHQLHWLSVQQVSHTHELAVPTYKVRSTPTLVLLHDRITERVCSQTVRSSAIALLVKPFTRTDFSRPLSDFQHRTVCLELTATNISEQKLCLLLNLDLNFYYSLRLSLNAVPTCHLQHPAVMTIWRYVNLIIIFFNPRWRFSRGGLKIKKNDVLGMTISPCSQRPANCCTVKLR